MAREAGESDGKERRAGRRELASVCVMNICRTGALGQFSQEFLARVAAAKLRMRSPGE